MRSASKRASSKVLSLSRSDVESSEIPHNFSDKIACLLIHLLAYQVKPSAIDGSASEGLVCGLTVKSPSIDRLAQSSSELKLERHTRARTSYVPTSYSEIPVNSK